MSSRSDEFQFRLAHWILDQLKSDRELENVVQQFSLLISQTQDQVVGDLYGYIARLIFQRAVGTVPMESSKDDIRLCAELCYYLYSIHLEQWPTHSPRIAFIHEHIFELCIHSFLIRSAIQSVIIPDGNGLPTGLDATPPVEDNKTWIEKHSKLLFHLFDLQLLNLAQISEYVFQVIKKPGALISTHLGNLVAGVRLLVGLFPGCSHGPWEKEVNLFRKWIDQHSSLNGNQVNATTYSASQEKEPRSGTVDTDNPRNHSALSSSNKSDNPSPKSFNAPILSSETAHSSRRYTLEEEETDGTPGNNIGRPPRTPDTSRAGSPVDTSSVDFSILPPEYTRGHTGRGNSIKEERRKASQAAECKAIKEAKHQTEEDSAARAREKTGRNAKEKRRFKEEAKRKEEIRAKLEAERKVNEQTARKAREEAEHKAKVDKMREEMEKLAKREAEIKARRAREQEAREEEVRKEMERKAKDDKARVDKMREEMERMVQKEAELKTKRAAEHRARVEKMREDMEKMVQREAELRAERERERKEKVRKAREEAEEEKERRQAELEAQKMTELQAKEEAKRKALEPVPMRDPAPPRGPPQWELDGYYDLLHRGFNPYMYAGGLPEP